MSEHPSDEDLSKIDAALMHNMSNRFQKLSKVVGLTMEGLIGTVPPFSDEIYRKRLIGLAEKCDLEFVGNTSDMRACEVRYADKQLRNEARHSLGINRHFKAEAKYMLLFPLLVIAVAIVVALVVPRLIK